MTPEAIDPDAPLLLHHGTTLAAAQSIAESGWQPIDPMTVISKIAAEHGLPVDEVVSDLDQFHRFARYKDRGTWASFTPNRIKAEHSWAQRSPEVTWESLWSVYRIEHMKIDDPWYWNSDVAGHAWVWDQMRNERLAIVTLEMSYNEMIAHGARTDGFRAGPLPDLEKLAPQWSRLPEVAFDAPFAPDPSRLTVTPIVRHLKWYVYAHKLGLSDEEFFARHDVGDFGMAASDGFEPDPEALDNIDRPWWDSHAVDCGRSTLKAE